MSQLTRRQVLKTARDAAADHKVLVAGTGIESAHETLRLTEYAAEIGYDVAMVRTPHYYKSQMNPANMLAFYRTVADRSPLPVIIYNFLHSVTLITDACHGYVEYMIKGIEVDRARVGHYVKNSLMLVTALAPRVGYDNAAKIAHTAHVEHTSLKEAAVKLGHLKPEEFDQLVRPEKMTKPE